MKTKKLISFDLQGTLSDSAFSDEFWLELLPTLYAKKHQVSIAEAKELLEIDFRAIGKYNELFYNHRLRLNEVLPNWSFHNIVNMLQKKPQLDFDVLNVIKKIPNHIPKIILSATTREFIDLELGNSKNYFQDTFSAIDDFNTPGKPPALFIQISQLMEVRPEDCLHIGDCQEMDFENAKKAGWVSYHFNKKNPRHEILFGLNNALNLFLNS